MPNLPSTHALPQAACSSAAPLAAGAGITPSPSLIFERTRRATTCPTPLTPLSVRPPHEMPHELRSVMRQLQRETTGTQTAASE